MGVENQGQLEIFTQARSQEKAKYLILERIAAFPALNGRKVAFLVLFALFLC